MSASRKADAVITFKPAKRTASVLCLGIAGPSGSGKTVSGLRLAMGLADGGMVCVIDTENGRALQYAYDGPGPVPLGKFRFEHGLLEPPFTPLRYLAAIDAAVQAGAAVVVVDSMSHEQEGIGGILDMHEAELTRMAGTDFAKREKLKFTAWIKPKAEHGQFIRYVQRMPAHLICCFRAKDRLEIKKNAQGKLEPTRVGWTPICADRMDYEMTATLILPPRGMGRPSLDEQSTKLDDLSFAWIKDQAQITEETGAAFRAWSLGETPGLAPPKPAAKPRAVEGKKPETPTEQPSVTNDLPSRDRYIVESWEGLKLLREATSKAAYNRWMDTWSDRLEWLRENRPEIYGPVEAERERAFTHAAETPREG